MLVAAFAQDDEATGRHASGSQRPRTSSCSCQKSPTSPTGSWSGAARAWGHGGFRQVAELAEVARGSLLELLRRREPLKQSLGKEQMAAGFVGQGIVPPPSLSLSLRLQQCSA